MFIEIDTTAKDPIYQQIRNQIVAGIATGELVPGTQLPSVRSLAADLGINLHTVNKAYAVLRDEGFVRMKGRAGAVIAQPDEANRQDRSRKALADLEGRLFEAALAFRANGGSQKDFSEAATVQAARAFSATGLSGEPPEAQIDRGQ